MYVKQESMSLEISTNILQLIKRGIPYIKAANNCRKVSK